MTFMTLPGKASTIRKTFSRETSVSIDIKAGISVVWALLTNASYYPEWNSTVLSIGGAIAPGQVIHLKSVLAPKRVFKLKVKVFEPEKKLVWGDAMGRRTFMLVRKGAELTLFSMVERIGGPLFPLFAGMIPAFDESFERWASDLKKEAENSMSTK